MVGLLSGEKYFARLGVLDPFPETFTQQRGAYFYYNIAAVGLACAQPIAIPAQAVPQR